MRFASEYAVFLAIAGMLVSPAGARQDTQNVQPADTHSPTNKPTRVISLRAKDSTFDPSVIHLKMNEKVELDVTAAGQPIGIRINPFPDGAKAHTPPGLSFLFGEDCYKVKKDQMAPILVEATEPGTYTFSCCKGCGSHHRMMQGRIVVDPTP